MDIWEYMALTKLFLKTHLIVIIIRIFLNSLLLLYDSFGWCSSLEVCIILTVTNVGNVETDIQPSSGVRIHTHKTMQVLRHTFCCEQILITILCNTGPWFYTKNKVALHIDWALIFILCKSKYKVYIWFDLTELMTGCRVNESCRRDKKSCKI